MVPLKLSFISMKVSLIQRLSNTVMHYCGTKISVLNREVSFIQGVLDREGSTVAGFSSGHFLVLHKSTGKAWVPLALSLFVINRKQQTISTTIMCQV